VTKLPENPTPAQLKTLCQALIRQELEPDAVIQGEIEARDNGWYCRYTTEGRDFEVEYDGENFIKGPVGAEEDFSEADEDLDIDELFAA
jgi:hypothetical protein